MPFPMKHLICITPLLLMLCACASTRKSVTSNHIQSDSLLLKENTHSTDSLRLVKTMQIKDTLIKVAAASVVDTLKAEDLQPAYTKTGTAVQRTYTANSKNAHAFLNVLPDGRIEYGCNADSLSIVVRSLIRENTELRANSEKAISTEQTKIKTNYTEQRSSVTRTRSLLAATWPYLLIAAVIIAAVYFIRSYLKWPF